ncbi:hypothetical protein, partial [Burkholderia vietnamiensis]|uniref:hypothetical protein n=1 Tax=Burkholderia vietnamiensis TaxID=60552 RepID=UPI002650F1EC
PDRHAAAELLIAGTRDASSWRYLRCMSGGHAPTISYWAPQPRTAIMAVTIIPPTAVSPSPECRHAI